MQDVVEAFWAESAALPTHAWHVGLRRAKELCILPTRGNKERQGAKKKISIAPGYCYLAAAEEFKISLCYSIYSRSLRETRSPRRKAPSHAGIYILTVCKTFRNTAQRVEGRGGGGGVLSGLRSSKRWRLLFWGVVSISAEQNVGVHFLLSPPLLRLLLLSFSFFFVTPTHLHTGSIIPPGIMGQL